MGGGSTQKGRHGPAEEGDDGSVHFEEYDACDTAEDDFPDSSKEHRPWPPVRRFSAFPAVRRSSFTWVSGGDQREHVQDTRAQDEEVGGDSRGEGVRGETSGGRWMEHSVEPSGNKVNKVDEIHPESQEAEVSRSPNSTSAWTRPMVSFSTSASAFGTNLDFKNYETATDGDERGLVSKELRKQESFTPGSILPTGTLRKQPEDEDAAVTDRLKPEEIAFLVEEVEKYQDEVEELFLTLNINDPNYKVPTILELCGEENNSITTAMESRGGRGFRCGLFNGREEEWLHQGLQPHLSRTTRRSMGCCALWTNFTHPESQHAHP